VRAISKGREPPSLTTHRQTEHASYDNYPGDAKQALRVELLTEQRGLCCYCMASIDATPTAMKVEHWECQEDHKSRQLDYRNLLGACLGGEGQPGDVQHCDTRKGRKVLKFNPADPAHTIEQRVCYLADGLIESPDEAFSAQLQDVLGLNLPVIKNRRKAVLDGLLGWLRDYRSRHHKGPDRASLQRERARWSPAAGSLRPFSPVAIWWLDQRLGRSAT
jgi:uncharacterized protein (TIGR02646 family)